MLPAETIKTGLGEPKAQGVTGTLKIKQRPMNQLLTVTNCLHEKSSFGVMASRVDFSTTEINGTFDLAAKKIGQGAKAEMNPET